jgi:hypothetical protein
MCSGRSTSCPVKKVAEMADEPTLCTCSGNSRAEETDDETLHYRTSDSLLAFRLNILLAKMCCRSYEECHYLCSLLFINWKIQERGMGLVCHVVRMGRRELQPKF